MNAPDTSLGEAIAVRRLSKRYETGRGAVLALDDIDFAVQEREFISIVGPSGCGKSTLLKILAGLIPASSGEAALRGTPIVGPRRDIGVVFQSPVLFPWRNVLDNVLLPADVQRLGRERMTTVATELLNLVGLAGFEDRYPWELSGGMQQRVAIARALAYNPAVLLMDEPFAALDALTRDDMQKLLADVWRETRKTVVYVTHNVAEAVYLADRVIVMTPHPGTVKTQVPITLDRPRDPLSVAFLEHQKQLLRDLGQQHIAHETEPHDQVDHSINGRSKR